MRLLQNDEDYTAVEVLMGNKKIILAHCNREFNKQSKHSIPVDGGSIQWSGPYVALVDGKQFN